MWNTLDYVWLPYFGVKNITWPNLNAVAGLHICKKGCEKLKCRLFQCLLKNCGMRNNFLAHYIIYMFFTFH